MTIPVLVGLLLATGPARADDECWVPMSDWQPRDAVERLAEANGWVLRRIKIDDGCYEVVAIDADGKPLEVKLNPSTLAILGIHHEDDDHETHDGDEQGNN